MKTNKIPCAVIKDLLPSYAEDLTSPETCELVREHLQECPDCQSVYEAMHEEIPTETEGNCGIAADASEIDYLKSQKYGTKKDYRIRSYCSFACRRCGICEGIFIRKPD